MAKAKQLTIKDPTSGDTYTLEYTRESVRWMEDRDFSFRDMQTKPMTTLPELFAGAFHAHHRYVSRDVIERIFKGLPDKESLFPALAAMYTDPIDEMFTEPEKDEKNPTWEANWKLD